MSMTANLVIESSQSIIEDLKAVTNLMTLPYHIRIGEITTQILSKKMIKIFGQYVTVFHEIHFSLSIHHLPLQSMKEVSSMPFTRKMNW